MYAFPDSAQNAAFREAVTKSHKVVTSATVGAPGAVGTLLDIVDGKVTMDSTAAVQRRAEVTLTDKSGTLTPAVAGDLLTTYGNELTLRRGIDLKAYGKS